jgi:hypothetical protein
MIEKLDNTWYQDKYLLFKDEGKAEGPKAKTRIWAVLNRTNNKVLGYVKWYAPWRKYCFFPEYTMCFDTNCMRNISIFCKDRTDEHKIKWKPTRVPDYDTPFVPTLRPPKDKISQTEGWINVIKEIGKELH